MHLTRSTSHALAILAIGSFVAGLPCYAQIVNFTLLPYEDANLVRLSTDGGMTFFKTDAGRYTGQFGSGPITNIYCDDLNHGIYSGGQYTASTQYMITSPSGPLVNGYYQGGLASALTNGDLTSVGTAEAQKRSSEVAFLADTYLYDYSYSSLAEEDLNQSAIGLSIWDIVQDGGDGLSAGQVQAGAADAATYGTLVNAYENEASVFASNYQSGTAIWVQAPVDALGNHQQDFVYVPSEVPPNAPYPPVPEASTTVSFGLLLALGLGGAVIAAKRKKVAA